MIVRKLLFGYDFECPLLEIVIFVLVNWSKYCLYLKLISSLIFLYQASLQTFVKEKKIVCDTGLLKL